MADKLNIAVIGCGYWGPNLIRNLNGLKEECRVVSICDRSRERLEHMQRLYPNIPVTDNARNIIDNETIDAVAIATPVHLHFDLARHCLESGKHTFIEKPMAASVGQCEHLIGLANRNGLTLMVGHTFIYSAPVRRIAQMIRDEELGEIYCINSRRLNLGLFQNDINVTWDLATHDISIILYLLQKMPVSLNCQGKVHLNGMEDVTNVSLTFSDGTFATIQSSWLDPNKVREMIIVGSRAMVVYDDTQPNEKIKIYDKRVEAPPHYDTYAEFHFSYHYGDMRAPFIQQTEPLKDEMQHFMECIRTGKTPITDGQNGLDVVRILEASTQSLRNEGGRIMLNGHSKISTSISKGMVNRSSAVVEQAVANV